MSSLVHADALVDVLALLMVTFSTCFILGLSRAVISCTLSY